MSTSTAYSTEIARLYFEGSTSARKPSPRLHDAACCLRSCWPVCLVFGIVLVALSAVATVAFTDTSIFNHEYVHSQLKFSLVPEWTAAFFCMACMLLGAVLGFVLFHFMLIKQQVAAFFSFGIPRVGLYVSRLVVGVACIVVTIAVPLTASLMLNIAAIGVTDGLFAQFAYCLCGCAIAALVAFLVMALSCALAGTMLEAVLFGMALLASVTVFSWGLNALMTSLLVGCPFGVSMYGQGTPVAESLIDLSAAYNPMLFFTGELSDHASFVPVYPVLEPPAGDWLLLGGWFVVCVVLACLGAVAVHMRRGENAGIAGNSPIVSFVVAAVVGFAVFAAAFSALSALDVGMALVAGVLVFVVCACVLLLGPLRSKVRFGKTIAVVVAEGAFICAVIAVVNAGLFGFATAVPDVADVVSVEVSVVGDPSRMPLKTNSMSKGTEYYVSGVFEYSDRDEVDVVRTVHGLCIDSARAARETSAGSFGDTVVPYDVVVSYALADGSTLTRYYDQAPVGALTELLALDGDGRLEQMRTALVTGDVSGLFESDARSVTAASAYRAYQTGDIYLADVTYTDPQLLSVDTENRRKLLAALAVDMEVQPLEDHYHPSVDALGVIMFSISGESAARSFAYTLSNVVVYVTPSFTNTLEFLESNDLLVCFEPSLPIDSIAFMKYDPYIGWNEVQRPSSLYFTGYRVDGDSDSYWVQKDYGIEFEVTDAAKVKELSSLLRSTWFMDDGGYLACAHIAGSDTYVYRYLPADSAPDYVVQGAR